MSGKCISEEMRETKPVRLFAMMSARQYYQHEAVLFSRRRRRDKFSATVVATTSLNNEKARLRRIQTKSARPWQTLAA